MSKQFNVHLSDKQKHLMSKELVVGHVEYLRSLKEKRKITILRSLCRRHSFNDSQS
ncbi:MULTISPECIES: hypothetical protein [unclassified Thermoactinomyces]|uniref:hypothetical protein n=1 Tax=unclassified Thermoactinomyces TaxID=2634588 RepID=UPI0018DD79EA|nr:MULTISPECIES: hypothetical protein [unclassified Thermoactinomyces]MBH8597675.1 hypothetical protein [Thermoactinomyces sp. CICC 10523]MBH8606450.1 hypothetical protein [Thermoactinomyces sp. CICC 10521]